MADNSTVDVEQTETENEKVDWQAKYKEMKEHMRTWESRAKDNEKAAQELKKLKDAEKSELEKAQEEAKNAKAALDALEKSAKLDKLKAKVASDVGIPAEFIIGDDEENMREYAQKLAEHFKVKPAPNVSSAGKFARNAQEDDLESAKRQLAKQMFGAHQSKENF